MKERERVLDLVKKGILSTEEALDLLEAMATEKDEMQIEKVADKVSAEHLEDKVTKLVDDLEKEVDEVASSIEEEVHVTEEDVKKSEEQDKENLEQILDDLATEANRASVELDEINVEIQGVRQELKEAQESLMALNTKEELDSLTEEELAERSELEATIKQLEASMDRLLEEKMSLEAELKNIRRERRSETLDNFGVNIEIPDDWKEQASETLNHVGEKMNEAGSQFGKFLKKTIQSVSEAVNDNVEWKDVNLRVPGVATTKFDHEFTYDNVEATIIDVKVANGNIRFKTWENPSVKVEGKFKLYGKMDNDSPYEALMERSQITVDDDEISFQIPNKRVRADLTFYLPSRVYDHVSVKLLNGNVTVEELEAKDVYTKSTNGNIQFQKITATMLEVEGVNGNIEIRSGEILDSIIETVNGTVVVTATPQNLGVSLVNGDIRATIGDTGLRKLNASSVNGNVKVALPDTLGLEGTAKTNLGSINSRIQDYEVVREKKERTNQLLQFRRSADDAMAVVELSTTTGNIYLKDTENK